MDIRDKMVRSINLDLIGGHLIIVFKGILYDDILDKEFEELYDIIENIFPFNWKNLVRQSASRNENNFQISYKFELKEMRSDFKNTVSKFFQVLNNLESNEKFDNIIQYLISIQSKYGL